MILKPEPRVIGTLDLRVKYPWQPGKILTSPLYGIAFICAYLTSRIAHGFISGWRAGG